MTKEKKEQLWIIVKLIAIAVCAMLYAWGGMEEKWLRRFLMPGIACGTIYFFRRDWFIFLIYPFWALSLTMGYGGEETVEKVFRRGWYGFFTGLAGSGQNFTDALWENRKKWLIVFYQVLLLVSAYIVFGVFNPFGSARIEETILGTLQVAIPILSAKRIEHGNNS